MREGFLWARPCQECMFVSLDSHKLDLMNLFSVGVAEEEETNN